METIQLEVTDFETAYNTFLGRSALSKFIPILHYAYLVLKIPGPHGIISIRGDVKRAFDCDRECCETADRPPRVEASLGRVPPPDPVMPEAKTSKTSIQPDVTPTFYKNKFFCPHRSAYKMHIKL
jgi:hypothetical protein